MNISEFLLLLILIICVLNILGCSCSFSSEGMKGDLSRGNHSDEPLRPKSNKSVNSKRVGAPGNRYRRPAFPYLNQHATNLNLALSGRLDVHNPYQADPSDTILRQDIAMRHRMMSQ